MSKTAIWDALGKTDPAHTKAFSRAGGFKGTALKPQWMIKRLTEEFGPVGVGWGMGRPTFETVRGNDGEVLVYCVVDCWHGFRDNVFFGVGGDKVIAKNRHGLFHDDEAFKKAYTDAIGNAFKFLGVGADIHMGQFDDSKYVEKVAEEFQSKISDADWALLTQLIEATKTDAGKLCEYYNAKSTKDLSPEAAQHAIKALQAKLPKADDTLADDAEFLKGD
jgi:hypothetical protein